MRIRKLSTRLVVALATFTIGVVLTMVWVVPRLPTNRRPHEPVALSVPTPNEMAVPDGWEDLDFNNKVRITLLRGMKRAEVGEQLRYARAYRNDDIYISIMDGEVLFPDLEDEVRKRKFYSCDSPEFVTKHASYKESLIEIDGRKAKLGIARGEELGGITARLCFPGADDKSFALLVAANCKDDRAFAIARQIFSSIKFKK